MRNIENMIAVFKALASALRELSSELFDIFKTGFLYAVYITLGFIGILLFAEYNSEIGTFLLGITYIALSYFASNQILCFGVIGFVFLGVKLYKRIEMFDELYNMVYFMRWKELSPLEEKEAEQLLKKSYKIIKRN